MKIHHIALTVKDLEKSSEFYTEHFSFVFEQEFTKEGWDGKARIFTLGPIKLELFWFPEPKDKQDDFNDLKTIGIKHIGFEVDDVQKTYEELKAKGLDLDTPKAGTTCKKYCFLRDPDGLVLELYEAK